MTDRRSYDGSPGSGGPSRRRRIVLFSAVLGLCAILCAAAVTAAFLRARSSSQASGNTAAAVLPLDIPAPNFTLTGQFGQRVSLADYRGEAVVLAFVDSECTTICPLTTSTLTSAVGDLGVHSSRVQLLGINANPLAASVKDVRAYSAAHGLLYRWTFLTGSRAELSVVWKAYHVYTAVTRSGVDHDPLVLVIDPAGHERALFHTAMSYSSVAVQAGQLATAIAATLGVTPDLSTQPKAASIALPSAVVRLPVIAGTGGADVQLGPGHPHLIVFLASWLTQTSDLRAQMAILNEYQRRALARGLPSLVCVDLATTEPLGDSLARTLRALHIEPQFPVASDARGALADGYQVQDAPWYALDGRPGGPAWHHDGWLSLAATLSAVTKAANGR